MITEEPMGSPEAPSGVELENPTKGDVEQLARRKGIHSLDEAWMPIGIKLRNGTWVRAKVKIEKGKVPTKTASVRFDDGSEALFRLRRVGAIQFLKRQQQQSSAAAPPQEEEGDATATSSETVVAPGPRTPRAATARSPLKSPLVMAVMAGAAIFFLILTLGAVTAIILRAERGRPAATKEPASQNVQTGGSAKPSAGTGTATIAPPAASSNNETAGGLQTENPLTQDIPTPAAPARPAAPEAPHEPAVMQTAATVTSGDLEIANFRCKYQSKSPATHNVMRCYFNVWSEATVAGKLHFNHGLVTEESADNSSSNGDVLHNDIRCGAGNGEQNIILFPTEPASCKIVYSIMNNATSKMAIVHFFVSWQPAGQSVQHTEITIPAIPIS